MKSLITLIAFSSKTMFFIFCYIWIRWTLPRFRFDQLMALGWKFMLPLGLGYLMVIATAVLVIVPPEDELGFSHGMWLFGLNLVLLYGVFWVVDRGRLLPGARLQRVGRA